jgi:TonB family protein
VRLCTILSTLGVILIPLSLMTQTTQGSYFKPVLVTANITDDAEQNVQDKKTAKETTPLDDVPLLVWNKKPEYPASALKDKAEGLVETKLYIDKLGAVSKVEITQSSGRKDLDDAALDAAGQYKFTPAKMNGVAVASWVSVPFDFRMSSDISTIGSRFEREELPPIIVRQDDKGGEEMVAVPKERKKDEGPKFSKIVRPRYPEVARMQHAQAQVDVTVTIDDRGDVIAVRSLSRERDDLVSASLAAAARCKFFPALRRGGAVESKTFVHFLFGRDKVLTDAEFLASAKAKIALPEPKVKVNPENSGVSIAFKNEVNSVDTLVIRNLRGEKVRTVVLGNISSGPQEIVWDRKDNAGKDMENGVYFYIITATPDDGSKPMKYFGKVIVQR